MGYEGQFKSELRAGYVYVLTCPHQPGIVRIGSTLRDIGKTRRERFGTAEPVDCTVEFAVHVPDRQDVARALQLKFAPALRSAKEQLYAASPDQVISAIVSHVGFDYTNAPVTAVIFRKQIQALQKREADLRKNRKNLAVMSDETSELRGRLQLLQGEIADRDGEIARLSGEIETLSREHQKTRRLSVLGGSAALVLFFGAVALSFL